MNKHYILLRYTQSTYASIYLHIHIHIQLYTYIHIYISIYSEVIINAPQLGPPIVCSLATKLTQSLRFALNKPVKVKGGV